MHVDPRNTCRVNERYTGNVFEDTWTLRGGVQTVMQHEYLPSLTALHRAMGKT